MKQINWGVLGTAGIAKGFVIPAIIKSANGRLYGIAGRSKDKWDVPDTILPDTSLNFTTVSD